MFLPVPFGFDNSTNAAYSFSAFKKNPERVRPAMAGYRASRRRYNNLIKTGTLMNHLFYLFNDVYRAHGMRDK
jgi:hypothetical protein